MNAAPDAPDLALVIAAIVRRHGTGVLGERRRLHGLLRDHAPGSVRDIRMLMTALDAGAVGRLYGQAGGHMADVVEAEAARMANDFGCDPDLARRAVDTWARLAATLHEASRAPKPSPLPAASPQPSLLPDGASRSAGTSGASTQTRIAGHNTAWWIFLAAVIAGLAAFAARLYGPV